ncbi:MAG: hypothetical protein KAS32_21275 [Candidatus Peribacteraceae bacterium]|nr:hypothetical protein [Candidatus Peribacteraceae bacterium]
MKNYPYQDILNKMEKPFVKKKGQPRRIYFVRQYAISPHGYSPDSQIPCTSLVYAKMVARIDAEDYNFNCDNCGEIGEFAPVKIYPISKIKASYFGPDGKMLVAAQGDPGPVITIEVVDDANLIAEWWDEDNQEFYPE